MADDIYRSVFVKRETGFWKERKIRADRESDLLITQTDHKSSRVSTCGATFHAACSRAGTMQKAVAHTEARLTHPPSDVNSLGRYKVLPVLFAMATRPTLVFQSPVSRIRVTAPYLRSSITEFFRPLSLNLSPARCGRRGRKRKAGSGVPVSVSINSVIVGNFVNYWPIVRLDRFANFSTNFSFVRLVSE